MDNAHERILTDPIGPCTKSIHAIKVPDGMYKKGLAQKYKTLVLCDTPGLGDSMNHAS